MTVINLTPKDPMTTSRLPEGNAKGDKNKNISENSQTSGFFGKALNL